LFGPEHINNNDTNNFYDWKIGQFAGEAELTATATGPYSMATLFSPAHINTGNNDFSGWQIGAGTGENMGMAFAGKATLTAEATGNSNFSAASLFGPAHVGNGNAYNFSNWQIGQFAGEATLTATATGSSHSWAALFGPAHIGNINTTNDFSNRHIGAVTDGNMGTAFGGKATLHATANSSSSATASALFGPAFISCGTSGTNNNIFYDWRIGQFAGEAELTSEASISVHSSSVQLPCSVRHMLPAKTATIISLASKLVRVMEEIWVRHSPEKPR
jgi:hypothetical protein